MPLVAVHSLYHLLAYCTPCSNPLSLQPTGYIPSGSLLHLFSAGSALGGNLLPLQPTGYAPTDSLLSLPSAGLYTSLGEVNSFCHLLVMPLMVSYTPDGSLLPLSPTAYILVAVYPSTMVSTLAMLLVAVYILNHRLALPLVAVDFLNHPLSTPLPGSSLLPLPPTGYATSGSLYPLPLAGYVPGFSLEGITLNLSTSGGILDNSPSKQQPF